MKALLFILNVEAFACCVFGLWIHAIPLIIAGLVCLAVGPMLKKEISVDMPRSIH